MKLPFNIIFNDIKYKIKTEDVQDTLDFYANDYKKVNPVKKEAPNFFYTHQKKVSIILDTYLKTVNHIYKKNNLDINGLFEDLICNVVVIYEKTLFHYIYGIDGLTLIKQLPNHTAYETDKQKFIITFIPKNIDIVENLSKNNEKKVKDVFDTYNNNQKVFSSIVGNFQVACLSFITSLNNAFKTNISLSTIETTEEWSEYLLCAPNSVNVDICFIACCAFMN